MDGTAYRITTLPTAELCAQLDCGASADDLDAALADAGYARLDHGLEPGGNVAILAFQPSAGLDPGHRGAALHLAGLLFHVAHADGIPHPERLRRAGEAALDLVDTDEVGERLVAALAAYAAVRDPGSRNVRVDGAFDAPLSVVASLVYEHARSGGIMTDVALERAQAVGGTLPGWIGELMGNIRVEEPVVRVRRNDPADYERLGIPPPLAELISWLRSNPDSGADDFARYARDAGVDPLAARERIAEAFDRRRALGGPAEQVAQTSGGPSSITKSSMSGSSGPAGSSTDGSEGSAS